MPIEINYWLLAAIVSLALYAVTNVIDKILRERFVKTSIGLASMFVIKNLWLIILLPFIQILPLTPTDAALIALLGVLWVIVIYSFVIALSIEEVSRVVPVFNIYPIFVLLLSSIILKEALPNTYYLSFFLLFIGGIIVSTHFNDLGNIKISKAFLIMLVSCISFALYIVILKHLLLKHNFWSMYVLTGIAGALAAGCTLVLNKPRKEAISGIKSLKGTGTYFFIATSIIGYLAFALYQYSILNGPISIVAALDGFQSLFLFTYVIILSLFFPAFFREELTKSALITKGLALSSMAAGIVTLYFVTS